MEEKIRWIPWAESTEKGPLCFKLFTCLIPRAEGKGDLAHWCSCVIFIPWAKSWLMATHKYPIKTQVSWFSTALLDSGILLTPASKERMMVGYERLGERQLTEGFLQQHPALKRGSWCCCSHTEVGLPLWSQPGAESKPNLKWKI